MDTDQLNQLDQTSHGSPLVGIIGLVIVIFILVSIWKVFSKAGEPGWAVIVPIYNLVVLLKIAGKPLWWLILLIIPGIGIVFSILASLGVAQRFGKSSGFGVGLALLPFIFYPILGFGDAVYGGEKTA